MCRPHTTATALALASVTGSVTAPATRDHQRTLTQGGDPHTQYNGTMLDRKLTLHPAFNNVRLVLFDIDGTLLRTGNHIHGRSMVQACKELTGHDVSAHFGKVNLGGRTDRFIVNELLRRCGMPQTSIDAAFDEIGERATQLTQSGLSDPDPDWVLPGSREVISTLIESKISIGLVTGNLPKIAETKLICGQLWESFASQSPLISGYGDLSEDRNELARSALLSAQSKLFHDLEGNDVVVIGDTPRDIECAQAIHARSVGVSTGRHSTEELAAAGATHAIDSLEQLLL
jgi:phosphoglycolate phosphatase